MIRRWAAEHLTDRGWRWFVRLYSVAVVFCVLGMLVLAWRVWQGDTQATRATLAFLVLYLTAWLLRTEGRDGGVR